MKQDRINEFHNINKFPKAPGITVLGISIPLIDKRQKPTACYKASEHLITKIQESGVGATVVYSDGLYMNSSDEAYSLKNKHEYLIESHKNSYLKLLKKSGKLVHQAFTFVTWQQLMLDCEKFTKRLKEYQDIHKKDKTLQQYVKQDIESNSFEYNKYTISYILEETLLDYLVAKGDVRLQNDFVQDKQKWVLHCYHGKPHRTSVYLHQQNFFKLDFKSNIYQNCFYDLSNLKLYDYDRLDIDTFNFSK